MTFLDLFSGIGGFRRGFELAGHTCVGHVEIDAHADRAYRAIHNIKEDEFYSKDITLLKPNDLTRCDIWTFGFPCQDISCAGRRAGMDGSRSGLYFTVIDLLKGIPEADRPLWLVAENVKHLFSINNGWDFFAVLSEMASVGYAVQWALYNTKDFGIPQNRERVFIIGSLIGHFGEEPPRAVLHNPSKVRGDIKYLAGAHQGRKLYGSNGVATTILAGGGVKSGIYTVPDEPLPIITPNREKARNKNYRLKTNAGEMFTLTTVDRHGILLDGRARMLTPRECFRLQGFTDEDFDKAAAVCSETQLYKQAGNSVSVPVIYAIASALYE